MTGRWLRLARVEQMHNWLVLSNWLRTGAWTARGVLAAWLLMAAEERLPTDKGALSKAEMVGPGPRPGC